MGWSLATALIAIALCPAWGRWQARRKVEQRLAAAPMQPERLGEPLDIALSLRAERLGPLLMSWETIGGCGAGGTGGAGVGVKWIGHSTTGGLFNLMTQANYQHFSDGYNFIVSSQISRDITPVWQVGVLVPYVYKYYRDYLRLPTDISNSGLGDVNLLLTRRLGPINATALTLAVGLPTGAYDATYKGDPLTQEKQLGLGRATGSLILDHTIDESWGLIVLGGLAAYRGGENALGNYRSPTGSLYGYAGYFMGPFVPVLGLSVTHFLKPDRDRGQDQDVPLTLVAGSASIEWSNDVIAILAGISLPYSLRGTPQAPNTTAPPVLTGFQPWLAAIGITVSPF
jgi:hypothetical protein